MENNEPGSLSKWNARKKIPDHFALRSMIFALSLVYFKQIYLLCSFS